VKYHLEIPEEFEKGRNGKLFNLNCFLNCFFNCSVGRAGVDLKVSSAVEGKKKAYVHTHKFQGFAFYMLIRVSSIWMLTKKVPDFTFAS